MKQILLLGSLIINNLVLAQSDFKLAPPITKKEMVMDTYFETFKVEDPYRWLEDDRSSATEAWVKEQNRYTEKYLNQSASREKIKTRLKEVWNYSRQGVTYKKGNLYFCSKNNGLQNQSVLYIKKSISDEGTVLLDPNTLSADGTVALSGTSVSNDGKLLAYGISKAGSDWVEIHFKDIATKKDLPDVIKWVKFSGMSWCGKTLYYSRYDEPSGSALTQKNQFHKVYAHTIGTPQSKDDFIYGDKEHPNYNFSASVTEDEKYLCIYTSESTSGEKLMIKELNNPKSNFVPIINDFTSDLSLIGNIGPKFYLLTNRSAPMYRLVSFTLDKANEDVWETIIPQSNSLLESVTFCNQQLLVSYLSNVSSKLFSYDLTGKKINEIQLPGLCKINGLNSNLKDNFATYSISQFISPDQVMYLDAKTMESKVLFKPNCNFKSEDYITEQLFFESKDGTKIPMFITRKKNLQLNENTPAFVYGYGGFNISVTPGFGIDKTVFLENNGIYVVINMRGGGEYGEEWHKSGTKCRKQNVFDDFCAGIDFLVSKKYTSYNKVAIHGRSNGGLLIGAVMTQRPDICKVALPTVGVLDMLRFHLFTIGRAWSVDYGNSESKEEFNCLIKYSPLHNVAPNRYPATMVLTGDHDDRVVPAHSFKFAATLQEKNLSNNPMLIRIDVNAGHGAGKPTAKQIDEFGDMWSFVFNYLDIKY
jgi:prolyl oligopeptidase